MRSLVFAGVAAAALALCAPASAKIVKIRATGQVAQYGFDNTGFGRFTTDYQPPSGNLCAGHLCGGGFNFNRSVNGVVTDQAGGTLAPTTVTIRIVAGVPEPATWATMLMGAGMCGAALRRR